MDNLPHNGLLWEKVAEMNLSERDLIDSFDSEEDFVNYMARSPKIAWDSVKGSKLDKLKAKAKEEPEEESKGEKKDKAPQPKAKTTSMKDLEKRLAALESHDD